MLRGNTTDILNNIIQIFEDENIKMTVKSSGQASFVVGACTMVGGLLGGKIGLTLGGMAGVALNNYLTPGFKSIPQILKNDMTDEEKEKLVHLVKETVKQLPAAAAVGNIFANENVRASIISTVVGFIQNQRSKCITGCN